MISLQNFLLREHIEDISQHVQVGRQLGSNPGGSYQNKGDKRYVKFYRNDQQARSEAAAGHVYEALGAATLRPTVVTHNGGVAVATQWKKGLKNLNQAYHGFSEEAKDQLATQFVAAVVTKNWDAVGIDHSNMQHDPVTKKLTNVDLGGSMRFRAMGGHKDYSADISEHDSLRNPEIPAGQAFGVLEDKHIRKAVQNANLDEGSLRTHFESIGLEDASHQAGVAVARLNLLKAKYA